MPSVTNDPSVNYSSAPFNGPFSISAALIPDVLNGQTPYEGLWIPAEFAKYNSIQCEGSISSLSVQLYGSNEAEPPANQYIATIGGSETTNDICTLSFTNPNLAGVGHSVSYTVKGGDTATLVAAGLAAAINNDSALPPLGFVAANVAGVLTISFPTIPPGFNPNPPGPSFANNTILASSVSGSATETITITTGTNGSTIGSAITTLGLTQLTGIFRWIKARLNTLTSTGAFVSVNYSGVG